MKNKPTSEKLRAWCDGIPTEEIDAVLEWLGDYGLLTEEGKQFAKEFWKFTWH